MLKAKIVSYDPEISLLGYKSRENTNLKTYMHLKFHSSTNYNSQDMENTSKEETKHHGTRNTSWKSSVGRE